MSWGYPEDNGDAVTSYGVEYRDTSGPLTWITWPHSGTDTETTITGLSDGTEYDVRVSAGNGRGKGSHTPAQTVTTPDMPDPPVLSATAGDGEITLTWTVANNGAAVNLYRLWYQPEGGEQVRLNLPTDTSTSYTLEGLTNDTEYDLKLKARNAVGFSEWSETVTATPGEDPTRLEDEYGNAPTIFIAGVPQTFTLVTDEVEDLWVGVNYDDGNDLTDDNNLTTGSCPAGQNTGAHIANGDTITIRDCYAGDAEIRISKGQVVLNSYDVTVSSSGLTASMADGSGNNPESIEAGGSEAFTLTTNVSDFVWVGLNYGGDNHLSTAPVRRAATLARLSAMGVR